MESSKNNKSVTESKTCEVLLTHIHPSSDRVCFQLPPPERFPSENVSTLWYHLNTLDLEVVFAIMVGEVEMVTVGTSIHGSHFVVVPDS